MSNFLESPSVIYPISATGTIIPVSVAAAGTATGAAWVSLKEVKFVKVTVAVGAGGGSVALKLQQATDSSGTGVKDLATAAQVGLTAVDGTAKAATASVNVDQYLDVDNSFLFVRMHATVSGGTGTIVGATLEMGPTLRAA